MSKVLAFIGSPRKKSISTKILEQVLEGAKAAGAEIKTYNLNDEGVRGCQSCFYCRKKEGCAVKDYLQPMYEDIKEATGIVASFSNYFGNMAGQSKLWVDRLYPMLNADFSPRYPGKKIVTVFAQANPDKDLYINVMDSINGIFKLFAWELEGSLLAYDTISQNYAIPQELLDSAFEMGKKLPS